jgi:hypothetical protein
MLATTTTERQNDEEARGVTDTIRTVTGSGAQTLEAFFRANAAEFGGVATAPESLEGNAFDFIARTNSEDAAASGLSSANMKLPSSRLWRLNGRIPL